MNKKLGQEAAFASSSQCQAGITHYKYNQIGMSKRFYAACAAMQGVIASLNHGSIDKELAKEIAAESYLIADELLKQESNE